MTKANVIEDAKHITRAHKTWGTRMCKTCDKKERRSFSMSTLERDGTWMNIVSAGIHEALQSTA